MSKTVLAKQGEIPVPLYFALQRPGFIEFPNITDKTHHSDLTTPN
jgi:hypothetical protein